MEGLAGTLRNISDPFLCSICFETIQEAHVTKCGHTFCYQCIVFSIEALPKCPKCSAVLTRNDIAPNFVVAEWIAKRNNDAESSSPQMPGFQKKLNSDLTEKLLSFIASDTANFDLNDVNTMLDRLNYRKNLLEAKRSATSMQVLRDFLKELLRQKEEKIKNLEQQVNLIKQDLETVESTLKNIQCPLKEEKMDEDSDGTGEKNLSEEETAITPTPTPITIKKRIHAHFDDFAQCYFDARAKELHFGTNHSGAEPLVSGLETFKEDLVKFSRYKCLKPLATLNYSATLLNDSNIVSSIEFDKDVDYFAIAGVTKKIQLFNYNSVIHGAVNIHYPTTEMTLKSKISCVSWNAYHKFMLASSDYEGTVTIWDAFTGSKTRVLQEHEKRCWSIDFNEMDIKLLASGSDDAKVKIWDMNSDISISSLEAAANVCCVKFNPMSSCHLAYGSADHFVYYYDLRNVKEPLRVFHGHKKSVSYLRFLNDHQIVSASTDSQLKMWDVNESHCIRSFNNHVNEKNFVGLATDGDYLACGSENNSVYIYYKGIPKHLMTYKFESPKSLMGVDVRGEEEVNEFISAVCWRKESNVVVAANSQGIIKLLELC